MSNIKNLGDLTIDIPKNLEKVENVIIENDVFEIENKNLDKNLLLKSIRENEEAREKAEWVEMDNMIIENLVNQFTTYSDDNDIEWNKFDYNTYDYECRLAYKYHWHLQLHCHGKFGRKRTIL